MSTLTFNSSNSRSPSALSMGTGPADIFHKLRNKFDNNVCVYNFIIIK